MIRLVPVALAALTLACPRAAAQTPVASASEAECTPTRRVRCPTPVEIVAAANAEARQHPTRASFSGARHIYSYEPGALYELYASPAYVSAILLEPGEAVTAIAAGDT